jgi:hypothetical protein
MLKAWFREVKQQLEHRKHVKRANRATNLLSANIAAREKMLTDEDEKQALHAEFFDEYDQIWGPIEAYRNRRLVERARRMGIDIPRRPKQYDDDENWVWSPYGSKLTESAEKKIKDEIKELRRQDYEEFRKWTTPIVAGASLFISLLALLWKTKAPDPCSKNYYRSDAGECVFALKPAPTPSPTTSQIAQPVPGTKQSPSKSKTP